MQVILSPSADANRADAWMPDGVRYTPRDGHMPESAFEVRARRDLIIAAGTPHTPQILQRSGIGPRHVIEAAGA
jgi:choline dehydrogenase-like flavoprotein